MDTEKIKTITESLESLKGAQFIHANWALIRFSTGCQTVASKDIIRTTPFNVEFQSAICNELNEAIRPVLDKYIKIYEDKLKKCLNE